MSILPYLLFRLPLLWLCLSHSLFAFVVEGQEAVQVSVDGETSEICDCTDQCNALAAARVDARVEQLTLDCQASLVQALDKVQQECRVSQQSLDGQYQEQLEALQAECTVSQQTNDRQHQELLLTLQTECSASHQKLQQENQDQLVTLQNEWEVKLKSTQDTLQEAILSVERETSLRQWADESLIALQAQVEALSLYKTQAADLQSLLEKREQEMNQYKESTRNEIETLTRDLKDTQQELKDTSDNYFTSRRNLFQANERMRELHVAVTTTYINMTLIQDDIVAAVNLVADKLVIWGGITSEVARDGWNRIREFTKDAEAWYQQQVAPHLSKSFEAFKSWCGEEIPKVLQTINAWYAQHIHPFVEREIFPKVAPVLESIKKFHAEKVDQVSAGLQTTSQSFLTYLDLMEVKETSSSRRWLLHVVQYVTTNSKEVVHGFERGVLVFLLLWVGVLRILRRRRKVPQKVSGLAFSRSGRRNGTAHSQ